LVSDLTSVIVPMFNASPWIGEALSSAFTQDDADVEVIVVDDGSTDDSVAIVRDGFPAARLICLDHGGVSRARNAGTSAARGQFLQYLDADDVLAPGKIAAQLALLQSTDADVAFGDWQELILGANGSFGSGQVRSPRLEGELDVALFTSFWCPPAAYLFRRSVVEAVGGWHVGLPIIQDARFALDCALAGARFVHSDGLAAYYRVQPTASLSRRDPSAFVRDCLNNAGEVERMWTGRGMTEARRRALVECYAYVARASFAHCPDTFEQAYAALERLSPGYRPARPRHLAYTARFVGYRRAEALALRYRRLKARMRSAA
jgi:glycosyltransferase involved in cell wall biosynthesis